MLLRKAMERRCRQGVSQIETSESAWQKDMSSKRVGYNGDEVCTCQELTWDQVIAALPLEGHGACIDTLEWVCARTKDFLLNLEKTVETS